MSGQGHHPSTGVSGTTRPMTVAERDALQSIPKPIRNNAIGISILSMVMAVMINFVEDMVALLMPLVFCFIGLGLAVQARKSSGSVAQAVSKGTVTDVRGTPRWKGAAGGWAFGAFSVTNNAQLKGLLVDGVSATVTIVPEAKRVLSVNGVPLKKPVELRAAPGFESALLPPAPNQVHATTVVSSDEDLPPPPEEWAPSACPQCGQGIRGGAMFCEKCGHRLIP